METLQEERSVYHWFLFSILLKGGISVAEVVAGVVVLFIPPWIITSLVHALAAAASASPALSHLILEEAGHYTSGTAQFLSLYLLSRGLVKVFLIWGLLRNKLWAYPTSLVIMSLFVLYQFWQIAVDRSLLVVAITLFDFVVMYFIWREWKIVERRAAA